MVLLHQKGDLAPFSFSSFEIIAKHINLEESVNLPWLSYVVDAACIK